MSLFRNIKITYKIAIPALLLALIMSGVVLVTRNTLSTLEENTRHIVDVQATRAITALRLETAVDEAIIREKNVIIETGENAIADQIEQFKLSKERALSAIDRLILLSDNESRRKEQ